MTVIFLEKIVSSFGDNFFSFEALSMLIIMMYLIFHAHVNCMRNFNKIIMYQ